MTNHKYILISCMSFHIYIFWYLLDDGIVVKDFATHACRNEAMKKVADVSKILKQ